MITGTAKASWRRPIAPSRTFRTSLLVGGLCRISGDRMTLAYFSVLIGDLVRVADQPGASNLALEVRGAPEVSHLFVASRLRRLLRPVGSRTQIGPPAGADDFTDLVFGKRPSRAVCAESPSKCSAPLCYASDSLARVRPTAGIQWRSSNDASGIDRLRSRYG